MNKVIVAILLCCLSTFSFARSPQQRAAFVKQNPCPANQQTRGSCPGYIVDHIIPLDCGGPDHPSNMQWQTIPDAREKDKIERRGPTCKNRQTSPEEREYYLGPKGGCYTITETGYKIYVDVRRCE